MDYYFNQLMEIQNSTDHSFFLLDQDSEPRFVIEADKRTIIIPAEFQFLGVKTDQRSEKIYFEVDRIFDDVDLSTKTCVIQYINAGTDDVDEGIYPVTELDTTTVPGKIVFKWEVDNIVCKYAGVVAFSVRFYEIDPETKLYTYCWNTIPENLPVLDGLNVSGSVTEDFPTELLEWNARMAALNTEITNKISTADATMKADLKTAKGYMDGAQAARGGAEDAESRVQAIVAGNESYTKQQSHDLFALALKGTAEAAKSITIYPDKGSNVIATINGFTRQAGSGDPSPTNVRAITNGGIVLNKTVFNGSENWGLGGTGSGETPYFYLNNAYSGDLVSSALYSERYPGVPITTTNSVQGISGYKTTCYIRDSKYDTVDDFKAALQANPLLVWYATTDGTGTLYAPIVLEGGEYRATPRRLTAPLCEGDSVVSWARSGCDKVVVLDGSQNIQWIENSLMSYGGSFTLSIPDAVVWTSTEIAPVYSDALNRVSNDASKFNQGVISLRSADKGLVFTLFGAKTTAAGKQYLTEHPITVWYRSTNYTLAADIPVSLETHQQAVLVLDGTEGITLYWNGHKEEQLANGRVTFSWPMPYPYKSASEYSSTVSHFKFFATVTSGIAGAVGYQFAATKNVYICLDLSTIDAVGETDDSVLRNKILAYLAAQYAAGTPVTIVYQLATPITYAHPAVVLPALPDDDGKVTITGDADGTVSAKYNKDITYAFSELQSAILALGANLSL